MKTRTYTAAALLALFFGLFGCFEDSAFDNIGGGLTTAGLPIANLLIAPTYTVTYDGNGSTGGDVPVDGTAYEEGDLVTVLGNPGSLERYVDPTTYSFIGWNTDPLASVANYDAGDYIQIQSADITLYAIWTTVPTHTVTYDGNTSTGGTPPSTSTYPEGATVTVKSNTGVLTKTDYAFAGWYTVPGVPSTGGTAYNPGETFTMGSSDVTLYAKWSDQWVQDAYLKASNLDASDYFGHSVAISGSTIVVGAQREDSNYTTVNNRNGIASSDDSIANSGAAYVYTKSSAGNWYQDAYLKASNNNVATVYFGDAVAVDGYIIAVGAPYEDSSQTTIINDDGYPKTPMNIKALNAGAVYVFKGTYDGKAIEWEQDAYLKAPNAEADDNFGASVAVSGSTVVVGAPGEDSSQTTITNGETASADDSAASSGAVYVFKYVNTGTIFRPRWEWQQDAYLKAPNAEAGDNFGASVAVSGSIIVVGATGEDGVANARTQAGAAYVFREESNVWTFDQYLRASNTEADDSFGISVAVDGTTIVVGAPEEDGSVTVVNDSDNLPTVVENGASNAGAAYVFKNPANTPGDWSQDAYLKPPTLDISDQFGFSVAVSGNIIVVGALYEDSNVILIDNDNGEGSLENYPDTGGNFGAAYVFKKVSSAWTQDAYLKASNAGQLDNFGYSVGVSGYNIVVGAKFEDSNEGIDDDDGEASANNSASSSGAAYVFTMK